MGQEILTFFVYDGCVDSVRRALPLALHDRIQTFNCSLEGLFTDPTVGWTDPARYAIVIIPSDLAGDSFSASDELLKRFSRGLARLIVCGDEAGLYLPVPYTAIPAALEAPLQKCLWSHVNRFPGWGLTTLLPTGSKIWSERLTNEKQIAIKVEQAMDFISHLQPSFASRLLTIRVAIMTALAFALSNKLSQQNQKPAVLQIGVSDQLIGFSLRWASETVHWETWQNPNLPCQAMFSQAHASFVQLSAETNETELFLLFLPGQLLVEASLPTGIDFISSDRIRNASGLANQVSAFDFEMFEIVKPNVTTFARSLADIAASQQLKLDATKESV